MDIFEASRIGNLTEIERLLDGPKKLVSARDDEKRQPLHVAAAHGQLDAAKLLLERGAKLDVKDKKGRYAIHLAAMAGHMEVACFLKDKGANVDSIARKGWTLLHDELFVASSPCGINGTERLIEIGMNASGIGAFKDMRRAPLHLLMHNSEVSFCKQPGLRQRMTRGLLANGGDPNATDDEGQTPLHIASEQGYANCVVELLDGGAAIDAVDPDGATALFFAVLGGNLETVRRLLDRGAAVNVRLRDDAKEYAGHTPLSMTHLFGHRYIARLLVERGGEEPIGVELATPKFTELHSACWHGHIDDARLVLDDEPSSVTSLSPMGLTQSDPLNRAVTAGNDEIVALLLSRGASPQGIGDPNYSPLNSASVQGYLGVIRLLIDAGADVNTNAGGRINALHQAVFGGNPEAVRLLLESGADPNILDNRQRTPLAAAVRRGPMLWRHDHDRIDACAEILREFGGHE